MTKKTKTKTLILRRRVELRGRGVSRECRRPAQASVQAAVCRASQSAQRVEREPKQGPGSFARSVSTVSTAHNAYNTFLDPLTYLAIGGLKRTASVMPLKAFSCQLNLL